MAWTVWVSKDDFSKVGLCHLRKCQNISDAQSGKHPEKSLNNDKSRKSYKLGKTPDGTSEIFRNGHFNLEQVLRHLKICNTI